jgi:glycerate-2-kinase
MKTKKFEKKLTFNKKTIADLNIVQLSDVKGGKLIPATNPTLYCRSCAWHIIYGCS